jgi:TonB family protein
MRVRVAGSILGIAAVLGPIAVHAQGALNYYTAPKIKVRGKSTSPIAGAGTVVVKVFVKKDGNATSFSIVRSSNHGDDNAALELAKSSTYKAATKGRKAIDAFYDYTLNSRVRARSRTPSRRVRSPRIN